MQVCLRYSENPLRARLILNEGFLKLFAILNTFENQTSFRIFLGRTLINTAIDYLLKHRYLASSPEQLQPEQPVLIDDKALIRITGSELNLLVRQLNNLNRIIFNLHVIDGFSHAEIADKLGISLNTSEQALSQARKTLRKFLSKIDTDNYDRVTG